MRLKLLSASLVSLFIPPCKVKNAMLRLLGWEVGAGCKLGFSWVYAGTIRLAANARVGHGNFISIDAFLLAENSYVGHLNRMVGPLFLVLSEYAGIGNLNRVLRAKKGVTWGRSMLKLGRWSKITSRHVVDCSRSVIIGDYSIVAGCGSQLWTHGYLHAPQGLGRFRIDGSIRIGNNVYIGSACVFNAGVRVSDAITVGAASCIARSLDVPGLYVSQPLRHIELDYEEAARRHPEVRVDGLVERVVNKHLPSKP
jgi:acetyltransferase-like isoleucine patch superfamily enzyme